MRRRWLRTNTLMLMALVACCAALLGVLKNQYDASPLQAALRGLRSGDAPVRREAVRRWEPSRWNRTPSRRP